MKRQRFQFKVSMKIRRQTYELENPIKIVSNNGDCVEKSERILKTVRKYWKRRQEKYFNKIYY